MYPYLGDFPTSHGIIYCPFHTFDSNDPSASVAIAAFVLADIAVYKDGNVIQRTSTAGYALLDTDGIDFDGVVGLGGVSIDINDNTDAGFYAAGSDYWVIIGPTTIDAAVVNFIAATFSIDNRGLLRPTVAERTLDVLATGEVPIDFDTSIGSLAAAQIEASALNGKGDWNIGKSGYALTLADWNVGKTGYSLTQAFPTNFADMSITITTGLVTLAGVTHTGAVIPTVTTNTDMRGTDGANTATPLTAAQVNAEMDNALNTAIPGGPTADSINQRILAIDDLTQAAGSGDLAAILTDTGTTLQAELDGIQADTEDIQARLPAALAAGNMKSDILAISGDTGAADKLEEGATALVLGAAVGTPTTTVIDTDLTETTTDHFKGRIVTFTSGNIAGQSTDITGYNGTTKELTVTALTDAPAATDTFVIS